MTNEICYINLVENLGDIVACEPIARQLKNNSPNLKINWIVRECFKDVLINNPFIDNIIPVNTIKEADELCNLYESKGYKIYDCHVNEHICGVTKDYIHYNKYNKELLPEDIFKNNSSIIDSFSKVIGIHIDDKQPKFYLDDRVQINYELPKEYIVIHCKSSMAFKDWDKKKWNELVQKLGNRNINIIEIGKEAIINNNNNYYHNLTNIRDLQQIAYIIKNAKCFVGIDSAFAHFANCFDTYSILIFGAFGDLQKYNPYSGNYACFKNCTFIHTKFLSKYIPVNLVYKSIIKYLNKKEDFMNKDIEYKNYLISMLRNIFQIKNIKDKTGQKYKKICILGIKKVIKINKGKNEL